MNIYYIIIAINKNNSPSGDKYAAGEATAREAGTMVQDGLKKTVTGGFKSTPFVLVWIVGSIGLTVMKELQATLALEINHRYKQNKMPLYLYREAFGNTSEPPRQYFENIK